MAATRVLGTVLVLVFAVGACSSDGDNMMFDSFQFEGTVYEFWSFPNDQDPEAPCVGVNARYSGATTTTTACPADDTEVSTFAAALELRDVTFVVGFGLETDETVAVAEAVRTLTTGSVDGRRFFLIQLRDKLAPGPFEVPVVAADGSTRSLTSHGLEDGNPSSPIDSPTTTSVSAPSTTASATVDTTESTLDPTSGDSWVEIPAFPVAFDEGGNGVPVWSANRLVVWGGSPDDSAGVTGVQWAPGTSQWQPIADAPLNPRDNPRVDSIGTEVFVCCGLNASGSSSVESAVLDVASGEWRSAAMSPRFRSLSAATAWTGSQLYVLAGQPSSSQQFASYDPATDSWTLLPDPPYTSTSGFAMVWTGSELFAWPRFDRSGHPPLVFDPQQAYWDELQVPAFVSRIDTPSLAWTGEEVIAWGVGLGISNETEQRGAAWNPEASTWREIALPPLPPVDWGEWTPGSQDTIWTGNELIVLVGALDDSPNGNQTRVLSYSPTTDLWRELDPVPIGDGGTLIWIGDAVIVASTDSYQLHR